MHAEIIDDFRKLENLRANWDELYRKDPDAQLFLSWPWLSHTFRRHPKRTFLILAVRPDTPRDHYLAFMPLRLSLRNDDKLGGYCNELYMAGNYWADYTGFVGDPDRDAETIPALAAALKSLCWKSLHLDFLHMSEARTEGLLAQFSDDTFRVVRRTRVSPVDGTNSLICPYIELPSEFDTYLATNMSANTRQKFRRFSRRIDQSDVLAISESSAQTRSRDLDILRQFWVEKWRTRKGDSTERLGRRYVDILAAAMRDDMAYICLLWRGDQPLGALGHLIDWEKKCLMYYVAGRDEKVQGIPIGLLLHGHSIRWAIEQKIETYDFLCGNESFKYSYGVRERQIRCYEIRTRSGFNLHGRLDPRTMEKALERATRAQDRGRLSRAEAGYRQVLAIRPTSARGLRRLSRLLVSQGRSAEADEFLERLVELRDKSALAWDMLGRVKFDLGDYREARSSLMRAVSLGSDVSDEAVSCLGRACLRIGDPNEAGRWCDVLADRARTKNSMSAQALAENLRNEIERS